MGRKFPGNFRKFPETMFAVKFPEKFQEVGNFRKFPIFVGNLLKLGNLAENQFKTTSSANSKLEL